MPSQTIAVSLPTSTVYVSGTVNDVSVVWTLTGDNVWQATADRTEDETYHVALSIVSSSGATTNTEFTLYYGLLSLITDRTQGDVDRVAYLAAKGWDGMTADEKSEWLMGLKGAYNATDLNRVGGAVNYVANRIHEAGYTVDVSPKIDWSVSDIPTPAQMESYLSDVAAIRSALSVSSATPPVPDDMIDLTYIEANNIEQILLDVNALIDNMIAAWVYCGEVYCGEV